MLHSQKQKTLGASLNSQSVNFMRRMVDLLEISDGYVTSTPMVEIIESLGAEAFNRQFADSPQLLTFLEANFAGGENMTARHQLLEATDESAFSLRQWVESLHTLQSWLDARSLEMPIDEQIGYVCCAGESAGAGAILTHLPALVADMLEAYGCERAVKKR